MRISVKICTEEDDLVEISSNNLSTLLHVFISASEHPLVSSFVKLLLNVQNYQFFVLIYT